jgi:hypothetical protein
MNIRQDICQGCVEGKISKVHHIDRGGCMIANCSNVKEALKIKMHILVNSISCEGCLNDSDNVFDHKTSHEGCLYDKSKACQGCLEDQPNQAAHMEGPYGCLYDNTILG